MTPQPGGQDDYIKRPFADAEYRDRARRVREEMRRRGVDVLLVLSPPNLCYLTGFESIWYPPRAPVGAILAANDERLVFVDYDRHRTLVERVALYDDAVFYDYSTAVADLRSAVGRRGWQRRRRSASSAGHSLRGRRWWTRSSRHWRARERTWSPATGSSTGCGRQVGGRAGVRRRAGQIVDAAFASLAEFVRPGRTELEIAAHVNAVMARTVARSRRSAPWCRQGQTCGAAPTHRRRGARSRSATSCTWTRAGSSNRYHVDLCRTFAIGRDHPAARAVLEQTAGSVEAVREMVKPGDPLDVAQRTAEEYVFSRFPRERVWWVGGYALGIAMPPNWVGHTYLANDAFEPFTWEPGYVTNYENILLTASRATPRATWRRSSWARNGSRCSPPASGS